MRWLNNLFALCGALLALSACVDPQELEERSQSPLIMPPMLNTRPATFSCDDAGRVIVRPLGEDGRAIALAFANREIQLKSVPASEGQKYSDGSTTFWINGSNANLVREGEEEVDSCEKI